MHKHLQEMLDVGAIRRSCSPWPSAGVLVRKKNGSLRFCINLRKSNTKTIKDSYSFPRIEGYLGCLHGARISTGLDPKSSYWKVMIDDEKHAPYSFPSRTIGVL